MEINDNYIKLSTPVIHNLLELCEVMYNELDESAIFDDYTAAVQKYPDLFKLDFYGNRTIFTICVNFSMFDNKELVTISAECRGRGPFCSLKTLYYDKSKLDNAYSHIDGIITVIKDKMQRI